MDSMLRSGTWVLKVQVACCPFGCPNDGQNAFPRKRTYPEGCGSKIQEQTAGFGPGTHFGVTRTFEPEPYGSGNLELRGSKLGD